MATKSSKKPVRKTKTTAKKAVKAVKKTSAARSVKKTVSTATIEAKKTTNKVAGPGRKIDKFRALHGLLAFVFAVQAVLIVVLSKAFSVPVTSNYLTGDVLAEGKLVPASRVLFDVRMAWLVAAFLGVAAVYHLLISTIWYARYQQILKAEVNRLRLIEFVLGSGLVLMAASLLLGVRDAGSLILLLTLNAGVHVINYMFETGGIKTYPRLMSALVSKFIAAIAIVLGWYVVSSLRYGSADLNVYTYWLIGVGAVFFGLFSYVCLARYRKRARFANFNYTEKAYAVLSLLAKSAVAWIIFFGFLK